MPVIRLSQILLDVGVQWSLFVGVLLCFFENKLGASLAEKIPDQHAAWTVHEAVDRHRIFAFHFDHADGSRQTGWAQVAFIEPE